MAWIGKVHIFFCLTQTKNVRGAMFLDVAKRSNILLRRRILNIGPKTFDRLARPYYRCILSVYTDLWCTEFYCITICWALDSLTDIHFFRQISWREQNWRDTAKCFRRTCKCPKPVSTYDKQFFEFHSLFLLKCYNRT